VLDAAEVRNLSLWATGDALPDLTVLLDLDPAAARGRLDADDKPFDRLEAEKVDFHERVRAAFLALAAAEPDRFLVLDATGSPDELAGDIRRRVGELIGDAPTG
jgi:dTMP kinase